MTPQYRAVADHVIEQIRAGHLAPGDKLPSLRQLMTQHGVSQSVAITAIQWLVDQGWVRTEHGRGAYVLSANPEPRTPRLTHAQRIAALEVEVADLRSRVERLEPATE